MKGIYINTAIKLLKKHESVELAVNEIRKKKSILDDNLSKFMKAKLTFRYQVVYDPLRIKRVDLDGTLDNKNYNFLGVVEDCNHKNNKLIKLHEIKNGSLQIKLPENKIKKNSIFLIKMLNLMLMLKKRNVRRTVKILKIKCCTD